MKQIISCMGLAATMLAVSAQGQIQDSVPPAQAPVVQAPSAPAPVVQAPAAQPKMDAPIDAPNLIKSWPVNTKVMARHLIAKYGPPDAGTDERLAWNDHGKWSQIRLFREGETDNFPTTHRDIVENTILYDVPQDKAGELIKFDPALDVNRLSGTISARSDSEEANTLALNLADEIVRGLRDVDSARIYLRETERKAVAGKSSPYMDHLLFAVADRGPISN